MLQELLIDCPFCEKAKIKVRHKPSVTTRKLSKTATFGSRYNLIKTKEIYQVLEDCPNCKKTKKEIEKRLKEGKPLDHKKLLERIKALGGPTRI